MIAGEASSEYPTITAVDRLASFSLQAEPLLHALHLVTFASAKSTLRPVLSGVSFLQEKDKLTLVATDSYRLSEYVLETKGEGAALSCIIPTKILDELRSILSASFKKPEEKEQEGEKKERKIPEIEIFLSKQQIEMHYGNVRLLSRLIDGKFPDYKQILPKETKTSVLFPTRELLLVVKRMHYFAKEMNNTLTFHCEKSQTKIATPQTQAGKDEAVLHTEATGGSNKIALSSSYLLDFLSHIDADNVEMKVIDALHPALFTLSGNPRFLHLIMPLRLQEE